jgi:alpha-L-rhamnosidase
MSSLNHYAFGCVDDWIFRRLAGVSPLSPGYARIRIAPDVDGPLSFVTARLDTVRGPIAVQWSRTGGTVKLEIDIPSSVLAEIECCAHREVVTGGCHTRHVEIGVTR